jgi:hypothetical protein
MKQHKWHKEIKAWADGAEIEYRQSRFPEFEWLDAPYPDWYIDDDEGIKYRIKSQPKEENELNYYLRDNETPLECIKRNRKDLSILMKYLEKCVKQKEELQSQLKPQPKKPQYLYAYKVNAKIVELYDELQMAWDGKMFLGKIKLEVEDD